MKKVLKSILIVILVLILMINLTVLIKGKIFKNKVPSIFGYKPFIVMSGSMENVFESGDLIITKVVDTDSLKKGDIIAYRDSGNTITTHRIYKEVKRKGKTCFETKGDINNSKDSGIVCAKKVEGKYIKKIPKLGGALLFLQEPIGFVIMMVLIVIICLLIYFSGPDDGTVSIDEKEYEEFEKYKRSKEKKQKSKSKK